MYKFRSGEDEAEYLEIDDDLYKDLYKKIKVYLTYFSHKSDSTNEYAARFKEEFGLRFDDGHFNNIYPYIRHDRRLHHARSRWVSVVLRWIFMIVALIYSSNLKLLCLIGTIFIILDIIIRKIVKWYSYDKAIKYLCIAHLKQLNAEQGGLNED